MLLKVVFLLMFLLLSACGGSDNRGSDGRLRVVATTSIVADVVKEVGGERVEVISLMGPGVDPHLYKASEGDIRRLSDADLIFYNGLHLEAKMADVLERLQGRKRTVAVSAAVAKSDLLAPPEFAGAYDPHIWFDVRLWARTINGVRDALAEADPEGAEAYSRQAADYASSLEQLESYVRAQAERIPRERRVLVTAHDAFNYFGRAYQFEVRGLQGISTASEAGVADVQALADFIASRRIPAIFVESSVPTRTIEAVQAAVKARGFDVVIGGQLYSDALGSPGASAGTYEGMVRHNIDTIVSSLERKEPGHAVGES